MKRSAAMPAWPDPPEVPEAQRARAPVSLRYEDVSQDGRLCMGGMPHAVGEVFWRSLAEPSRIGEPLREQGVIPILTRLITVGGEGPISIRRPLDGEARYQLATSMQDGEVRRILLNVWVELAGVIDRTHGPPPERAGERVVAGRVFAEHVFTRPFAEPGRRRVTRLPGGGLPEVPAARWPLHDPAELARPPAGARPIDESPLLDPAPIAIGVDHTDSNQHVNSLVYPRWFRDAALRRLAALGHDPARLVRYQETAFRKPCFAGQRVRVALAAFELDGAMGVSLALLHEGAAPGDKAYCYGRLLFER